MILSARNEALAILNREKLTNAQRETSATLKRQVLAARNETLAVLNSDALLKMRGGASRALRRENISKTRSQVSAVLNRQVLTESDKKTLYDLKVRIIDDSTTKTTHLVRPRAAAAFQQLKRAVANEKTTGAVRLVKAQVVTRANRRTLRRYLEETWHGVGNLVPEGVSRTLMTETNKRRAFVARKLATSGYAGFRLWLKKPVTVGTVLVVMVSWALALTFSRFAFPWSEIGYTSGYGAIFMTAAMTARLTVNSQKLWLEQPRRREAPKEPAREVNRWIIETALARRSLVLHEIQEFLASGMDGRVKEVNLKANAFLMRKKDWQALQDALYDTFLRGAPPLLFELGHRLGVSVGRDLMRLGEKPAAILSQLQEVSRTLGWGIVSVHGDLARGSRLVFTVRESPFCVAESPLEKNKRACHMLVGMMSGIAEEVYGWPCSSVEQRCIRDGNDCCKIVVTPTVTPVHKERWNLSVLFPVQYPWTR